MPRLRLPTIGQGAFDAVFGYVYTGLAVNLSLVAANAPLAAALVFVRRPLEAWPFLLLLSLTVAPSLAAAFAAFRAFGDGGGSPFAAFWRGWARGLRRAAPLGAALVGLELLVGLDLAWLAGTAAGALLAPVLLVVLALATGTVTTALALNVEGADAPAVASLRAALYLAVRRWPLTLVTLAALAGAVVVVLAQPVLGALLALSPLLYVAHANTRVALATPIPGR